MIRKLDPRYVLAALLLVVAGAGLLIWSNQDRSASDRAFRAGICGDHACASSTEFDDYMKQFSNNSQQHFIGSAVCFCAAVAVMGVGFNKAFATHRSAKKKVD